MTSAGHFDRTKLAKVLARLGSEHDGERAAAGLLANRMVDEAGLSWEQLLAPPAFRIVTFDLHSQPAPPPAPSPPRFTFADLTAQQCGKGAAQASQAKDRQGDQRTLAVSKEARTRSAPR